MRIWQQRGPRLFEYSNSKVATDGREVVQEDFQGITGFNVIEQGLDWNSCSSKDRCREGTQLRARCWALSSSPWLGVTCAGAALSGVHRITSSARSRIDCGIVMPRALAVFKLTTRKY